MALNEVKAYLEAAGAKFIHVGVISDNMEKSIETLEQLPFVSKFSRKKAAFGAEFLTIGKPYAIELAFAQVEGHDFQLEILQPVEAESDPENIYSVLLRKYGPGLSHLAYSVPNLETFNKALSFFEEQGDNVILKGSVIPGQCEAIPKGNAFVYVEPKNGCNCFIELLLDSLE